MNAYDFTVKAQDGSDVRLSDYSGKVLLIVNTATGCGFTPQYKELQEIYEAHHKDGLEILDFPCNQFGGQAPGSDAEIHDFCTGRYGITFPQFAKIVVNGENAIPLFKWLTATPDSRASTSCTQSGCCSARCSRCRTRTTGSRAPLNGTSPSS